MKKTIFFSVALGLGYLNHVNAQTWNVPSNGASVGTGTYIGNTGTGTNPLRIASSAGGAISLFTGPVGTASNERMRILSNGNVGIGLTNPTNKLEVNGTFRSGGIGTFASDLNVLGNANVTGLLKLQQTTGTPGTGIVMGSESAVLQMTTYGQGYFSGGGSGYGVNNIIMGDYNPTTTSTDSRLILGYDRYPNNQATVAYMRNGNNQGIYISQNGFIGFNQRISYDGTPTPTSITGPDFSMAGRFKFNGTVGSTSMIVGADYATYLGQTEPTLPAGYKLSVNGKSEFKDQVDFLANTKVNGFVQIGTAISATNPTPAGYKLYVEQGILTEKVKVALKSTSDWADYVFEPNYKLRPLQDVEAYISANKHLPDVPSAQEMVNGGLDVAKSDALLLQKIEELTLYMIEQNKKIEALQTELTELKK
jgi:hypothetical protein